MLHGCGIALSSAILCSDAQIISWIPSSSSVSLAAPFFLPPIWTLAVNTVLLSAACRHSSCTECTIYSTSLERCIPYSFQGTQLTHMPVFLFLCYFLLLFFSASASCTKCPDLSRTLSRTVKPHVNIPVVARDILYLVFDPRPSPF